ncbi:hypothetical protein [Chroococcus sp. FPU101]|uniref:hypothetical protein n=1 Tax=Chroococcus sp. FPU101 TaxID=1974212 RepID=UPI001A8CEF44|nr:hypothetical protein [Chroococcus sp. FPU101]GFE68529.1 hypothetical protein CFPU101_11390 [Chroococcus sp. FPU101]
MIESIEKGKTATMAELTIQIPDELAEQLEPLRDHIPQLLSNIEPDLSIVRKKSFSRHQFNTSSRILEHQILGN